MAKRPDISPDVPPVIPRVGCGPAIRNDKGHLLLLQRLKQPEAGFWGLPGGKVDFGELSEASVKREIYEELGIVINILHLACISEIIDKGDNAHWLSPVYEAQINSRMPTLKEPKKHEGWDWFSLDNLPENLTTPTKDYLRALAQKGHVQHVL